MTTTLLIARHGNTFGPTDTVTRVGITDLPLVESGIKQAQLLGNYLKNHDLVPDVIFTSQLKRAIQTASEAQAAMNTHLPMESLSIFNEIDYGPDENLPESQVVARIGEKALHAWETEGTVPNGWKVNPADLIKNWQDFAGMLKKHHPGKKCLLVTSNGIARFSPYLTGDFKKFCTQFNIKLSTGAFSILENQSDSKLWQCQHWNIKPS